MRKRFVLVLGVAIGLLFGGLVQAGPVPTNKPAAYPAWWFELDVIKRLPEVANKPDPVWPTDYPPADDYAAVNQGQVKNVAKQAYEAFSLQFPGAAGTVLDGKWKNPAASGDDYRAINSGQLKNVADPFYNALSSIGIVNTDKPWTISGLSADDYALVNIGQVKNLFSFVIPSMQLLATKPLYTELSEAEDA